MSKTIEIKIYQIEEHPQPEKVYDWIRNNWYDLNEHTGYEIINSLKALQQEIGGTLNYGISAVPDRGEYITFEDYDEEALAELDETEYPLTGCSWDQYVITGLRNNCLSKILDIYHQDTDYVYSDEGLYELCAANGYEFELDGTFYRR
jgi:hypothetical protein